MSERIARMKNEMLRKNGTPNTTEEANINSGQGSCTLSSNSFPEGVSSCKLFTLSPSLCLVAHGKLHNFKSDTLHGRPLPKGHVKVSIDIALEPNVSLPIPIDDDGMMTIGQAIGLYKPIELKQETWFQNLSQTISSGQQLSSSGLVHVPSSSNSPFFTKMHYDNRLS
ncbi:hypothetical protein VIGAN_02211900 [Vigna angularis var. angularis]|uniref:DUF8039 domain-containing protein n=1 Tax=Vigna angularis var. angularis TaxID=157739 RepID=A0A0S3RFI9_PHAAN|nr:hypothetical protein VIGAN_02211900 [Vigna angularis var. angularis]